MIRLSGRSIRSDENSKGDIEIVFTGLRSGEKLYEELLVGTDAEGTIHPKIMRAKEEKLAHKQLEQILAELRQAIQCSDPQKVKGILGRAVAGYDFSARDVDWMLLENNHEARGSIQFSEIEGIASNKL